MRPSVASQGALLKAGTNTARLTATSSPWSPTEQKCSPQAGCPQLSLVTAPWQGWGQGELTLGGPARAFVAHALQGGEGHVEITVGTRPEAPQAVAVEVRVRLWDAKGEGDAQTPPGWGGVAGRAEEGCTHSQAVVGEKVCHPVATFHLIGLHLHPLEKPWELGSGSHSLGTDVKVLFLQPSELAQAVRHLQEDTRKLGGHTSSPHPPF